MYIHIKLRNQIKIITVPKSKKQGNHNYLSRYVIKEIGPKKESVIIAQHLPNQTRVVSLIIQTKPFPLTRPDTKPYWGQQGQESQSCQKLFGLQVSFQVVRAGWTRPKRVRGGRCSTTTGNSSECQKINFVELILYPREQLLSIKMKLENLQSEYGCSSNFLLIFEDNVTEKVNLRGRDSLTAGRFLLNSWLSLVTK